MEKKVVTGKVLSVIVGVSVFVLGSYGGRFMVEKLMLKSNLQKTAASANEECPFMVDMDTRMDSVVYLPPKTLLYHYTLVHIAKEDLREDIDQMLKLMEGSIIFNLRQSPDIGAIGRQGVIFRYEYKDMNGQHIHTFDITPEKYKN